MKTIVCGPPHSGKSVFISNLVRLMPSESFLRIMANGDGEGTWSNNPNQNDVVATRVKGSNTEQDFEFWKSLICNAHQQIVIVDIGGKLQDDKGPLFDACDSFIVVSNNEDIMQEWIHYGEQHGCECIGTILSTLGDCQEEIVTLKPFPKCKLSGLERGHNIHGSRVLSCIADTIVTHAKYKGSTTFSDSNTIDLFDIGKKLGCSNSWFTHEGIEVSTIWYTPNKAKALYEYLCDNYNKYDSYKVFGAVSIWVSCIVTMAIGNPTADNLEFYDAWTDSYIKSQSLSKCSVPDNEHFKVLVEERNDCVRVSFILSGYLDSLNFRKYKLPEIHSTKPLFISGRFPNWFVASVIKSYSNPLKHIHIPGIGFITVECENKFDLGNVIT